MHSYSEIPSYPWLAVRRSMFRIIEPNRLRLAPPSYHLLQHADHRFGGQRSIHFDRQHFSSTFIQNVECLESSPAIQRITYKVDGPNDSGLRENNKRLSEPDRNPLLGPTGQIQAGADNRRATGASVPPMAHIPQRRPTYFQNPQWGFVGPCVGFLLFIWSVWFVWLN